jgi:hypothetical protein
MKMKIQEYNGEEVSTLPTGIYKAADGLYVKERNDFVECLQKTDVVNGISYSLADKEYLTYIGDSIPIHVFYDAWEFFKQVNEKHNAEAIVLLCHTKERGFWIDVPTQTVSSGSLQYETGQICNIVGSIHSHNTMSAFHSSGDVHDEEYKDGIHITIGNIDKSLPSISISLVYKKKRYTIDDFKSMFDIKNTTSTFNMEDALSKVTAKTTLPRSMYSTTTTLPNYYKDDTEYSYTWKDAIKDVRYGKEYTNNKKKKNIRKTLFGSYDKEFQYNRTGD